MTALHWLTLGTSLICTTLAPLAHAQEAFASRESVEFNSRFSSPAPRPTFKNVRAYPTAFHEWVGDLEKAGIYNRGVRSPYKVALPLMELNETGSSRLMLTYGKIPGSSGARGVLFFVVIKLE